MQILEPFEYLSWFLTYSVITFHKVRGQIKAARIKVSRKIHKNRTEVYFSLRLTKKQFSAKKHLEVKKLKLLREIKKTPYLCLPEFFTASAVTRLSIFDIRLGSFSNFRFY